MRKVLLIIILFVVSGAVSLSIINCRTESPKVTVHDSLESFTEIGNTFQIKIPGKHDLKESTQEGFRLFELSAVDEDGVTIHVIRVRIFEEERDLYNPSYESSFLSECKCSIVERGSVHYFGKPALHYTVLLRNGEWIGYQRHFAGKGKMFILSVNGPKSDSKNLRALFDQAIANFVLLEN